MGPDAIIFSECWILSQLFQSPLSLSSKGSLVLLQFLPYGWCHPHVISSLVAQMVKRLPTMRETWVWSLGWEDPLGKEIATHSSTLAWKIHWMEERGRPQSMGSQRVRHDWATSLSLFTHLCAYVCWSLHFFCQSLLGVLWELFHM